MTKETLHTFSSALTLNPEWGTLGPAAAEAIERADKQLGLSSSLRRFYAASNPCDVEVPWVSDWLFLYAIEELWDAQEGYRYSGNEPSGLLSGWEATWIVVGDCGADPIIVDSTNDAVLMAQHGIGTWAPLQVARDLDQFLLVVSRWLRFFDSVNGRCRQDTGELTTEAWNAWNGPVTAGLSTEHRKNLLSFVG
jgi:hypothetical protein